MLSPLVLIAIGFGIGAFGTLVGIGGGFILVPTFLFITPELPPEKITAISLTVIFFNTLSGSAAYLKKKRVDIRSGLIFAVASTPGSILGAILVQYLPQGTFNPLFGSFLILGAIILYLRPLGKKALLREDQSHMNLAQEHFHMKKELLPLGVLVSLGVGMFSSLLGIGGGIIHVPTMANVLEFPVHFATATSHFVMVFMTGVGAITHLIQGDLKGMEVPILCLAPSVIIGAQVGAQLSDRIHGRTIIKILALAIAFVGIRLILS